MAKTLDFKPGSDQRIDTQDKFFTLVAAAVFSFPAVRRWRCELVHCGGSSFLLLVFNVESQINLSTQSVLFGLVCRPVGSTEVKSGVSTDDVISRYRV